VGRKASKATDNIYYVARSNAAKKNGNFSSRERAALLLGIERSRLARIELDKIVPYSEEVLIMAREYDAPYLCADYCKHICPIGIQQQSKSVKPLPKDADTLERLALRFLSSIQQVDDISNRLINISKDGIVEESEYESLHSVLQSMDELTANIQLIRDWINNSPKLRDRFRGDFKSME